MSRLAHVKKPRISRGVRSSNSTLIAVGGGKGGVGKSFVSSTLGTMLAHKGYKTVIVDLDLGSANIHTCLGEPLPSRGLEDFVIGKSPRIEDLLLTTQIPNLRILSGTDSDKANLANITMKQQSQLMSSVFNLDADYTIMDLSAGTHNSTLDFFLMAQHKILVVTPEPSSIENAYRFMKAGFFRYIQRYQKQYNVHYALRQMLNNPEKLGIQFPADVLTRLGEKKPERAAPFMHQMMNLEYSIILNQVRTHADRNLGPSIKSVCSKYFGLPSHFLGHLEYDNAVWRSVRQKRPLLLESPTSPLYAQMLGVIRQLTNDPNQQRAG